SRGKFLGRQHVAWLLRFSRGMAKMVCIVLQVCISFGVAGIYPIAGGEVVCMCDAVYNKVISNHYFSLRQDQVCEEKRPGKSDVDLISFILHELNSRRAKLSHRHLKMIAFGSRLWDNHRT